MDHRHVTPARIGQAEVEQPVRQHLPSHGDRFALEQREIRDPQHPGPVLLQEHHVLGRSMQSPPLLDAALQRSLTAKPLLAGEGPLQVQEKGLGFELRRLLQHGNQNAVPDVRQWISAGTPVTAPTLLLSLRLQLTTVDPLGAAHRDAHRISSELLAEATGPFGHVPLLDPQRQGGGHRGAPDRDRSLVVAS